VLIAVVLLVSSLRADVDKYEVYAVRFATMYVGVQTRTSAVVIASDNMYLYENLDARKPIAQTLDAVSNLRAQDRMRSLASDPRLVIPGHDPAVLERFPHVSERIVRIE